jgi:hypothetical protein
MGIFVRWDVIDGRLSWSFDQDKIAAEKLFDGCYIVSGEVPKEKMAAREVVATYKKLGLVEEASRSLKTVQFEVRPVYHKTDDRIRSHVFLCTLAYYLQWHLKQRLEPLFAADDLLRQAAKACRTIDNALGVRFDDPLAVAEFWTLGTRERATLDGATGPTSSPIPPWSTAFYPLIGLTDWPLRLRPQRLCWASV